jgi:hypothetical protein
MVSCLFKRQKGCRKDHFRQPLQAERVGFEPTEPCGSRALQARALGRTTQPLHKAVMIDADLMTALAEAIINTDQGSGNPNNQRL